MWGALVSTAAVALLAVLFSYFHSYRKLRTLPGPFLARISHLFSLRIQMSGDAYIKFYAFSQKYGS